MVLDSVVNSAHFAIGVLLEVYDKYRDLVLLKFPHAQVYLLGANAIAGATRVQEANAGKPRLYWLHSFLLVLLRDLFLDLVTILFFFFNRLCLFIFRC